MELKEDSIDFKIKLNTVTSTVLSTEQSWSEHKDSESAKELVEDKFRMARGTLEDFTTADEKVWKRFVETRVLYKEWGKKKTLGKLEDSFHLSDEDREFFEKWIEIYRQVRLSEDNEDRPELSVEEAQHKVEKGLDNAKQQTFN